jgi:hypothetical protein
LSGPYALKRCDSNKRDCTYFTPQLGKTRRVFEITCKSVLHALDTFKGQSLVSLTEELFGWFDQDKGADLENLGPKPKSGSETMKRRLEHFLGATSNARIERLLACSSKACLPIKEALGFAIENGLVPPAPPRAASCVTSPR